MKAIYAFSGDPITYGHIDIIERAYKMFPDLVVGIGVNPDKKYTFTLDERMNMAKECLKHLKGVTVVAFEGLLVDYAYEHNIQVIIRGIRTSADLEYEYSFYLAGKSQKLNIETVPMFTKPEKAHISSSMVKSLVKEQGQIESFVPAIVKQNLEAKILGQYIMCVTGTIGTGKSYVTSELVKIGKKRGIEVHDIDLDIICHEILSTLTEPRYVEIRRKLVDKFGSEVANPDGSINRHALGNIVFNNKENLAYLNSLIQPAINERMRRNMYGKKGIILINAALLVENNYLPISNNNVLLVTVSEEKQEARLRQRGYTNEQIASRVRSQYNSEEKLNAIREIQEKEESGRLLVLDTTQENYDDIEFIFDKILDVLKYE